jgi:hypothetical protein
MTDIEKRFADNGNPRHYLINHIASVIAQGESQRCQAMSYIYFRALADGRTIWIAEALRDNRKRMTGVRLA